MIYLLIYLLGGLTFLPALLILVFVFFYLTLSEPHDPCIRLDTDDATVPADEDTAQGYFAIAREFPHGEVSFQVDLATKTPSVYQNVYRSMFKTGIKPVESTVYYVVLRHGHLILSPTAAQLNTQHVISLEHYTIGVCGDEEQELLEGELWAKRNAIRLQGRTSYFLFAENCSAKEDFYHALLASKRSRFSSAIPEPQKSSTSSMMALFRSLHSAEDQLHTRWINALIGRVYLALSKTSEAEHFIRRKLVRKIAKVRTPAFLSDIVLGPITLGDAAPQILNPRLRDLTVDGDCCVEADVAYGGGFRLEVAALARLDLGTRFKAREMNLILAVMVKSVRGHMLIKVKPAPSNRLWMTFEGMPEVELVVEPVVGSRQITYSVIRRAIENRIKEVLAETLVLPNWDDISFLDTAGREYRGGIWAETTAEDTGLWQEKEQDAVADVLDIDAERHKSPASCSGRSTSSPMQPKSSPLTTAASPSQSTLSQPIESSPSLINPQVTSLGRSTLSKSIESSLSGADEDQGTASAVSTTGAELISRARDSQKWSWRASDAAR